MFICIQLFIQMVVIFCLEGENWTVILRPLAERLDFSVVSRTERTDWLKKQPQVLSQLTPNYV